MDLTPNFQYAPRSSGLPSNPIVSYFSPKTILVATLNAYPNSVIYRTTDLGTTWDSGFQTNKTVTKFAFISPNIGFASGTIYDLNTQTETATIDKTTDGGFLWTNIFSQHVFPPSAYFKNAAGLYAIAFADSLHGYACGDQGLILQTTDGGVTWNEMPSDYTFDDQGIDLLSDVAYPDTNHAIIASSDGSVLVYLPKGILSLPNITYPHFSPTAAPKSFDITWDPVSGATRYSISVTTSDYPNYGDTTVARDSNVTSNFYHLSNLIDTAPPPQTGGRQYEIHLQAFNATNESNVAHRTFIVYQSSGVVLVPEDVADRLDIYPNPATNWLTVGGFSRHLIIYDALGREHFCIWDSGKLNIGNLPMGIYYVSDGTHRARFVKE